MKQRMQRGFMSLMKKFNKRFFVFDLDDKRAIMYFNSSSSTDKPNDVIPLGTIIDVRQIEVQSAQ